MYVMNVPRGTMSPTVMRLSDKIPPEGKSGTEVNVTTLTRRKDKRRVFLGKSQEESTALRINMQD